jgi:hypothetical protein
MNPPFWPVDVEYDVRRTVYVEAPTEALARSLALDPANWANSEHSVELLNTLRLARQ